MDLNELFAKSFWIGKTLGNIKRFMDNWYTKQRNTFQILEFISAEILSHEKFLVGILVDKVSFK